MVLRTLVTLACWAAALAVLTGAAALAAFCSRIGPVTAWAPLVKACCRLLIRCFPIRLQVRGTGNLPRGGPCIFIANHVNILDAFMLEACIPRPFTALERERHFRWPIYGTFVSAMGHIPLPLDGAGGTAAALRRADRALRRGLCLVVMPEGNWTEDGTLAEFGRGAFRLAQRNRVPIAPLVLAGFYRALPARQWSVRGGTVRAVFGRPIDPRDYPGFTDEMLAGLAHREMLAMLEEAGDRGTRRLAPPRSPQADASAGSAADTRPGPFQEAS